MEIKTFLMYKEWFPIIATMTNEQAGELLKAIYAYQNKEPYELTDGLLLGIFNMIKTRFEADTALYEEKCERNRENGARGGRPKKDNTVITSYNKNNTVIPIEEPTDKTNYQEIADLYNSICVSYPKLKALSDARKKAIKARLKKYTVDDIKRVFEKAEQSDFLKGGNGRNWAASFDWLLKDSNFAKVLDGNYDNKQGVTNGRRNNIDISAPNSRQRADYEEIDKILWG